MRFCQVIEESRRLQPRTELALLRRCRSVMRTLLLVVAIVVQPYTVAGASCACSAAPMRSAPTTHDKASIAISRGGTVFFEGVELPVDGESSRIPSLEEKLVDNRQAAAGLVCDPCRPGAAS